MILSSASGQGRVLEDSGSAREKVVARAPPYDAVRHRVVSRLHSKGHGPRLGVGSGPHAPLRSCLARHGGLGCMARPRPYSGMMTVFWTPLRDTDWHQVVSLCWSGNPVSGQGDDPGAWEQLSRLLQSEVMAMPPLPVPQKRAPVH